MLTNKRERIIMRLAEEQRSDGSFGRFHTADSKLRPKQKIPTTQAGAWLMYENSLTRGDNLCDKTCAYMERLLNDLSRWPDAWESNKWFKPAVPLFIASSISPFGSDDRKYKDVCDIWIDVLISAFGAGGYSKERGDAAATASFGVGIDGSYIGLHGLNNLALYAFNAADIPSDIQKQYMKWLRNYDGVIAYTDVRPGGLSRVSGSERIISLLSKFAGFEDEFPGLAPRKPN